MGMRSPEVLTPRRPTRTPERRFAVSDVPSVAGPQCAHAHSSIGIERSGSRLAQVVYLVERCTDCVQELARKKATRGYDSPGRREAS